MKGYFLIIHEQSFHRQDGIGQKMRQQIETFREAGLDCEPYFFPVNREMEELNVWGKAAYLLPFSNFSPRWQYDEKLAQADFLYFRHPPALTGPMVKTLRRLKKENPALRVIMEIPTYPFEKELRGAAALLQMKNRRNRTRLRGLVDALAVIGVVGERLWGLDVLPIINGCRVSEIPAASTREDGCIDLIAVARFAPWHGYDRLIRGMGAYYRAGGEREVKLHLVGESSDGTVETLRRLAEEENVSERVLFHGFQRGEALHAIYEQCDLGVTTMGMHRRGFVRSSDLKSREYLAKGLAVVSGAQIDVLHDNPSPWYLEFPADDSDIELGELIAFYDRVYPAGRERAEVSAQIRAFAREHCDMAATMRPVIRLLRGEDGV